MVGMTGLPEITAGEVVHRLPRDPIHLWQLNSSGGLYHHAMGCGAFSTAMAISAYRPADFISNRGYDIAHGIHDRMLKVPFSGGGTFELQNALALKAHGFQAAMFVFGTFEHLAAAIDLHAPVILLVEPVVLNIGRHDVLLVGYSRDAQGEPLHLFIDNPWLQAATQDGPGGLGGLSYPGNSKITAAELHQKWTGTFTPVFPDSASFQEWRRRTGYRFGIG